MHAGPVGGAVVAAGGVVGRGLETERLEQLPPGPPAPIAPLAAATGARAAWPGGGLVGPTEQANEVTLVVVQVHECSLAATLGVC